MFQERAQLEIDGKRLLSENLTRQILVKSLFLCKNLIEIVVCERKLPKLHMRKLPTRFRALNYYKNRILEFRRHQCKLLDTIYKKNGFVMKLYIFNCDFRACGTARHKT